MASRAPRDFGKGPVWKNILAQALPLTVAQAVLLLYNVVDRIYIGHMGENGAMALTGLGLTFPVVTIVMAFAALFGMGGVPLFSIARGEGDDKKAGRIPVREDVGPAKNPLPDDRETPSKTRRHNDPCWYFFIR